MLLLVMLTTAAFPQTKGVRKNSDPRINKKSPTVYLAFVRNGTLVDSSNSEKEERIWLRLHNNSRWPIWIDASGASKGGGDASLYYDTLSAFEKVDELHRCHVCSTIPIAPGRSILFSIPKEDLTKTYAIRTSFEYEWERYTDISGGDEPTHYVYFYSSELPKTELTLKP